MRPRPENDRARRAALEALDARLRRLREEQQVSCRLDALTGAGGHIICCFNGKENERR